MGAEWLFPAFIGAFLVIPLVHVLARPRFAARPILNKSEIRLRHAIAKLLPRDYHLLAQVSYGEMLVNRSRTRFLSINAKRADLVICDGSFRPVAVVEYQGGGHFGPSWATRIDTHRRDRQKRQALREANIPTIEVPARYSAKLLSDLVAAAVSQSRKDRVFGTRKA